MNQFLFCGRKRNFTYLVLSYLKLCGLFLILIVCFIKIFQYWCRPLLRRRQWHPTPVLLPGKSHGQRSLVGCSPGGQEESDTTQQLHFHFSLSCIGEGNGNPLQCSCLKNPRDGESGGLLSMGSHRVGHDWSDLAAAAAEPYSNLQQTSEFKVFISVPRIVFNEIKTTDYIKISTLRHFNTSRNTENPI